VSSACLVSGASRGTASARLPSSVAASARSASEKLDAMTPTRGEVTSSASGSDQAPGRQPHRASTAAAAVATSPT
jgi:hypothetical protein